MINGYLLGKMQELFQMCTLYRFTHSHLYETKAFKKHIQTHIYHTRNFKIAAHRLGSFTPLT